MKAKGVIAVLAIVGLLVFVAVSVLGESKEKTVSARALTREVDGEVRSGVKYLVCSPIDAKGGVPGAINPRDYPAPSYLSDERDPGAVGSISSAREPRFAPGRFLVKFNHDVQVTREDSGSIVTTGIPSIDALNREFSVASAGRLFPRFHRDAEDEAIYESLGMGRIYLFAVPEDVDIPTVVEQYQRDPSVESAGPDYIAHNYGEPPEDHDLPYQWGLENDGKQPAGYPEHWGVPGADIAAFDAWEITKGGEDIILAVLDTGVKWNHEDLRARMWVNDGEAPPNDDNELDDDNNGYRDDYQGVDFIPASPGHVFWDPDDPYDPLPYDNDPMDDNGHGTAVAGVACAATDNNIGIAGVDWKCKAMAVKVANDMGRSHASNIARGIYYAAYNGADVINMSFGGADPDSIAVLPAVYYAYYRGCTMVAAMGNYNEQFTFYPAGYREIIAVGATDTDDTRCDTDDWGVDLRSG